MMHAGLFRNHDWSRVWTGNAGGFFLRNAVSSQYFGRDFRLLVSLIATPGRENIVISWILIFNDYQGLPLWSCWYEWLLLAFSVWTHLSVSSFPAWSCCLLDDVWVGKSLSCLLAMLCQLIHEWCRSGFWFWEGCIQVFFFIFMWSCLRWSRSSLFVRFDRLIYF